MNYENDDHQHTEYIRPSTKFRCGRAARWGKPCWQGPNANKKCGGTSECSPVVRGERYYCQRPKSAGGACSEGPLPDGACAHTHLACRPRDNLRTRRGLFSLLGVFIIVVLITLFSNRETLSTNNVMLTPDSLSSVHAGYPITDQCENCHKSHNLSTTDWFMSAFTNQDMSEQCTQCHTFKGNATTPHNLTFKANSKNTKLECISCHREHKGVDFDISKVSDEICGNCHETSFTEFSDHSKFDPKFPHQQAQNIFFDHAKHLGEYFTEDKWLNKPGRDAKLGKSAKKACNFCHQVETAGRDIKIRDYQTTCAGCHDQQIKTRAMTVLTQDQASSAFINLLENNSIIESDDWDEDVFTEKLIKSLSKNGLTILHEKMESNGIKEIQQRHLFSGLDSNLLKSTTKNWLTENELESESENESGWFAAENDDGEEAILYKPEGHTDNVMRSWIELYLKRVKNDESSAEVVEELLDIESGAGACGKCHGSMAGRDLLSESKSQHWGKTSIQEREFTSGFSHRPHIDLLSNSQGCESCHKLSDVADYPAYFKEDGKDETLFQSNFKGITMESCTSCHNKQRISDDCQLCHVYHKGAGFKFEYQMREMKEINHE